MADARSSAYDDYFKAYSVAVMGGNERSELLYGGKSERLTLWKVGVLIGIVIMPPSALAKLCE